MAQATARYTTATARSTSAATPAAGCGHRKVTGDHANRTPAVARSNSTVTRATAARSTHAASTRVTTPAWVVGCDAISGTAADVGSTLVIATPSLGDRCSRSVAPLPPPDLPPAG